MHINVPRISDCFSNALHFGCTGILLPQYCRITVSTQMSGPENFFIKSYQLSYKC